MTAETLAEIEHNLESLLSELSHAGDETELFETLNKLTEASSDAHTAVTNNKAPDGRIPLDSARPIIVLLRKNVGTMRQKGRDIPVCDTASYDAMHSRIAQNFIKIFRAVHSPEIFTFSTRD